MIGRVSIMTTPFFVRSAYLLLLALTVSPSPFLVHAADAAAVIGSSKDPSSYSNVDQFVPSHISLYIAVDFTDSSTSGTITHTMNVLEANVTTVYLDVRDGLTVFDAEFKTDAVSGFANYTTVPFDITTPNPNIGSALAVTLPVGMRNRTQFFLRLTYKTKKENTALSWMTPAQTSGKVLPFVYSLCELNFCRDLAPMMDTPSAKITYDATVLAPSEFTVAMSANNTGSVRYNSTHTTTMFNCTIKLPSYLIAIVVGDLAKRSLSDRVSVMSEPSIPDSAVAEFEELPKVFDIADSYLTPYIWGNYTILIMPPSFPWGGMEHPLVTFASHTLITGDKSEVYIATHELTHSWFGNDVGCQNWNNFWLNEGLNVFMERKVTAALRGTNFARIAYFTGNISMYSDMLDYGLDNPYSSLYPNISDADPEDSYSTVPYEKGAQFTYWMESMVGVDNFQVFLRSYLDTFAQTSINSEDFAAFYEAFVKKKFNASSAAQILNATDLQTWIYEPGLPPDTQNFTTIELDSALRLAREYAKLGGVASPKNYTDFFVFFSTQKLAFVQELSAMDSVDAAMLAYVDSDLNLTYSLNPSVKNAWYVLGVSHAYETIVNPTYIWLGEQGRNAYVRPIFRALVDAGNCSTALEWYNDYEGFYNSYVIAGLGRDLAPCNTTVPAPTSNETGAAAAPTSNETGAAAAPTSNGTGAAAPTPTSNGTGAAAAPASNGMGAAAAPPAAGPTSDASNIVLNVYALALAIALAVATA